MFSRGVPTTNFSISDVSGASTAVLFSAPADGLNVAFAFIMAERGVPGDIVYGAAAELTKAFGPATFTPGSPYFNSATQLAGIAMAGQGVELMRLVDPDAETATIGLFLQVTEDKVVQYKKNVGGERILDGNGDPTPKTEVDGVTIVKENGVILKWIVRKLASNELFNTLTKKVATVSGKTQTTYPILAGEITSPGKYGDRQGFKLFSSTQLLSSLSKSLNSAMYRFIPVELPTEVSTTASVIPDVLGFSSNDVSFKHTAVYAPTNTNYAFRYVLGNRYVVNDTGETTLPYHLHVYSKYVEEIGNKILTLSPELGAIDPYLIDLVTGADSDGLFYDHVQIDEDSNTVVSADVINYASGGSDGDTSWEKYEELVAAWLTGSDHGEFSNLSQHPMTHYYDPGFSQATKFLLFNMLDLRDNFKVDVSTQDISRAPNTKAEDIAAGQALVFRAQMHPQSTITGVGCHRVGIYAHAAELINGTPYGGLVPFTLNRLVQRRNLDGGQVVQGSSGGLPNSLVTLFRKPNWVADDKASQSLSWDNCINSVRHASRTEIHYPTYRTVYPNDTSILSDDETSDLIIYMYKIARRIYAIYAGTKGAPKRVFPLIERDINIAMATAFSKTSINIRASVGQSAFDENLGYAVTAALAVTDSLSLRVMNFDVTLGRTSSED